LSYRGIQPTRSPESTSIDQPSNRIHQRQSAILPSQPRHPATTGSANQPQGNYPPSSCTQRRVENPTQYR